MPRGTFPRHPHTTTREPTYWSRQSLSSPSPVEAEMDLLVLQERSRRGIRNSGYDVSMKRLDLRHSLS